MTRPKGSKNKQPNENGGNPVIYDDDRALSRKEQETIIVFNKEDDYADIFTYQESWQSHLEKLGYQAFLTNQSGGKEYRIPKYMIKKPRGKRQLTEETRRKMAERLSKAREAKK